MSKEREEEALRERKSNGKRKLVGGDDDTRVIYRHYATLYFVYVLYTSKIDVSADIRFVVDGAESELGIPDLIQVCRVHAVRPYYADSQVFVESLDRAFENVCELDLIFHFDEVSLGGTTLRDKLTSGPLRPR